MDDAQLQGPQGPQDSQTLQSPPGPQAPPPVQVGDALPAFTTEPLSRLTLALYCGASGDHNPIHVDLAFAQRAGMPDVFAHGMLSMAWIGRLLTNWRGQAQLREFGVRFVAITQVGESITCSGTVVELLDVRGEARARVAVQTANARGEIKLTGDAVVAIGGIDSASQW